MLGNSACLKAECPVFSPQFYLQHKCAFCGHSVVHHRAVPPDLQRSITRAGLDEHSSRSSRRSATVGVTVEPFTWPRHGNKEEAQTVEVLFTVHDFDLSRVRRSFFPDGTNLSAAARAVTHPFSSGGTRLEDLPGKWFLHLDVSGKIEQPRRYPRRWYGQQETAVVSGRRRGPPDTASSPLVPPSLPSSTSSPTSGKSASSQVAAQGQQSGKKRGLWSRFTSPKRQTPLSPGSDLPSVSEQEGEDQATEAASDAPARRKRPRARSAGATLTGRDARTGSVGKHALSAGSSTTDDLPGGATIGSPGGSAYDAFGFAPAANSSLGDWYRSAAAAGGRVPTRSRTSALFGASMRQPFPLRTQQQSMDQRRTCFARPVAGTIRFPVAVPVRLPRNRGFAKSCYITVQLMYESDRGAVNVGTCTFSADKWLGWSRRRPGSALSKATCSTKALSSPAGALGSITAHARATRAPRIFRMCAPINGTLLSRSFVFQGPSPQRQLVVSEEATEVMFGVQVPCQFLRFRLQHLMQQRELLLLTLQAVLESLPLRVEVSAQDYLDSSKDTLKLTQKAKECRRAGRALLPVAAKVALDTPTRTTRGGIQGRQEHGSRTASPITRRRTEQGTSSPAVRALSGDDAPLHMQRSISSASSSIEHRASGTDDAAANDAMDDAVFDAATGTRGSRAYSAISVASTLPPAPTPPSPTVLGAPAGQTPLESSDSDDGDVRMSASAFPVTDLSLRWRLQVAKWLRSVLLRFGAAISKVGALVEGYQRLYNHAARFSSRYNSRGMDVLAADDELARATVRHRGIMRSAPFFKTSTLKKQPALSALPTNLHLQLLSVEEKEVPLQPEETEPLSDVQGGTTFSGMPGGRTLEDTEAVDCYDMVKAPPRTSKLAARRPSLKYAARYAAGGAASVAGASSKSSRHIQASGTGGWSSHREQVDAAVWGWGSEVGHKRRRSSVMRTLYARPRRLSAVGLNAQLQAGERVRPRTTSSSRRLLESVGVVSPEQKDDAPGQLTAVRGRGGGVKLVRAPSDVSDDAAGAERSDPVSIAHSAGGSSGRPVSVDSLAIVGSAPRFAAQQEAESLAGLGGLDAGDVHSVGGVNPNALRERLLSEACSDSDEEDKVSALPPARPGGRSATRASMQLRSASDVSNVSSHVASSSAFTSGAAPSGRVARSRSGDEATALTRAGFDPLSSLMDDSDSDQPEQGSALGSLTERTAALKAESAPTTPLRSAKRSSDMRASLASAVGGNLRELRRASERSGRVGSLALGGRSSGIASGLLPPSVRARDAEAGEALLGGLLESRQDSTSGTGSSVQDSRGSDDEGASAVGNDPQRSDSHVRIGHTLMAAALVTTGGLRTDGGDSTTLGGSGLDMEDSRSASTAAQERPAKFSSVDQPPEERTARSGTVTVGDAAERSASPQGGLAATVQPPPGRRSFSHGGELRGGKRGEAPAPPKKQPAAPPRPATRAVDLSAAPSELRFVPLPPEGGGGARKGRDDATAAAAAAPVTFRHKRGSSGRLSLALLPRVETQLPASADGASDGTKGGAVPPTPPAPVISPQRFEGAISSFRDARARLAKRLKSSGDASYCYATVTLGAPAAQAKGFTNGGLYKRRADSVLPGTLPACLFVEHWVTQTCSAVLHRLTAEAKAVEAMRREAADSIAPFKAKLADAGTRSATVATSSPLLVSRTSSGGAGARRRQKRASILETATAAVAGSNSPRLDALSGSKVPWLGLDSTAEEDHDGDGASKGRSGTISRATSADGEMGSGAVGTPPLPRQTSDAASGTGGGSPAVLQWTQTGFAAIEAALNIQEREDDTLPQLLAAVVTAFTYQLDYAVAARRLSYLNFLAKAGFLVQIESLLSTAGDENGMLEDFMAVSRCLGRVAFRLRRAGGSVAAAPPTAGTGGGGDGKSYSTPAQSFMSPMSGLASPYSPHRSDWSQGSPMSSSSQANAERALRSISSDSASSGWAAQTGSSPTHIELDRRDSSGSAASGISLHTPMSRSPSPSTDMSTDANSSNSLVGGISAITSAHTAAMRLLRVSGIRPAKPRPGVQSAADGTGGGSNKLTEWMTTNDDDDDTPPEGTPSAQMRRMSRSLRTGSMQRHASFNQSRHGVYGSAAARKPSIRFSKASYMSVESTGGAAGMASASLQTEASAIWDAAIDGALEASGQMPPPRNPQRSRGTSLEQISESRRVVPSLSQGARPSLQPAGNTAKHGELRRSSSSAVRRSSKVVVPNLLNSLRVHRASTTGPQAQRDVGAMLLAEQQRQRQLQLRTQAKTGSNHTSSASLGRQGSGPAAPVDDVTPASSAVSSACSSAKGTSRNLLARRTTSGESTLFNDDDSIVFTGADSFSAVDMQGRGQPTRGRHAEHDRVAFDAVSRGTLHSGAHANQSSDSDHESDIASPTLAPRDAALSWFWKADQPEKPEAHTAAHDIRRVLEEGLPSQDGRKLSTADVTFSSESDEDDFDEEAVSGASSGASTPHLRRARPSPSRASQAVIAAAEEVNDILDGFASTHSASLSAIAARRPSTPQGTARPSPAEPPVAPLLGSSMSAPSSASRRRSVSVSDAPSKHRGPAWQRGRRFNADEASSDSDAEGDDSDRRKPELAGAGWGTDRADALAKNATSGPRVRGRVFSAQGPHSAALATAAVSSASLGSEQAHSGVPAPVKVSIESQLPSGLDELRKLSSILDQRISRKTQSGLWQSSTHASQQEAKRGGGEEAKKGGGDEKGSPSLAQQHSDDTPQTALPEHLAALANLNPAEAAAVAASIRTLESMAASSTVLADSGSDIDLDVSSDEDPEDASSVTSPSDKGHSMGAPDGDSTFMRDSIKRSSERLHRISVSMQEYEATGSLFERVAWHLHKRGAIATTLTAAYSAGAGHSAASRASGRTSALASGGAAAGSTGSEARREHSAEPHEHPRHGEEAGGSSGDGHGGWKRGQPLGYDPSLGGDTVLPAALDSCEGAGMVLDIEVDSAVFDLLPPELTQQQIHIVPVMFTQGINEQQSFVNAVGGSAASIQSMVNVDGTSKLNEFAQKWGSLAVGAAMVKLDRDLATLATQVRLEANRPGKHHQVLTLAADITRMLHGARITCCKSGKDRTAMSVTYEEARILRDRHGLPRHNTRPAANLLREEGVRLPVCAKNVGVPVYAFNSLQVALLPKIYKPPSSTIASSGSGVAT